MATTKASKAPHSTAQKLPGEKTQMGLSKIVAGTVLLALLTVLGTYIFGGFEGLSTGGIMALILGVSFSYALGVGLMVILFHSSRFYDDSPHNAALDQFKDRRKDS